MASVTLPSGWTKRRLLHQLIDEGLQGTSLIVVANREPSMHRMHGGQNKIVLPAGGVTAARSTPDEDRYPQGSRRPSPAPDEASERGGPRRTTP